MQKLAGATSTDGGHFKMFGLYILLFENIYS